LPWSSCQAVSASLRPFAALVANSASTLFRTFATSTLPAAVFIQPKLIVQPLSTKPEFARNDSQDLLLRTDDQGSTSLYVEQGDGAILAVFDVTDPDHTLTAVTRQINRPETGTVFLLTEGKVTVIRQRDAERQYTMDQELKGI